MHRRHFLHTLAAAAAARPASGSALCVEGYIFEQYAARHNRRLADILPDVFSMVRKAGFHNVELGPNFFAGVLRDRAPQLLHAHGLRMPSVYAGGILHEGPASEQTIDRAAALAALCVPFGCRAVVTNPDPKHGDAPKTDAELEWEANALNRMAQRLRAQNVELRVHHHTPQLENNAREWRYLLAHTDAAIVKVCVDVDWAYEGDFAPIPFLEEAGSRVRELHIRSARHKVWLESVEDSDIDYRAVAEYLRRRQLHPELVVELAWRPQTVITRPLEEDLRLSREYVEQVFEARR